MKNPLQKRIPRELKRDFGKYIVIFAFLVLLIGLVSGFNVATESSIIAYDEGITKYNMEDGHLTFDKKPEEEFLADFSEAADIDLYEMSYVNQTDSKNKKVRIYEIRKDVNTACLMEGELPKEENEIAIDRLFSIKSDYQIGDTMYLDGKNLTIVGLVALPDYSSLFENNNDMMFNATNFTIALMTKEGMAQFGENHKFYNYAWKYRKAYDSTNDKECKDLSDDLTKVLEEQLKSYDEGLVEEAVEAGKLVMLHKMLEEIDEQLKAAGMELSMYDSKEGREQLLSMIQAGLEEEGIDLSEEFADGEKEITLTEEDIALAFKSTGADLEAAQEVLDTVKDRILMVSDYVPRYANSAINFTREDMGGDRVFFIVFAYLVIVIIAFVFGVTTMNTITQEAGAIGTLRAMGYTRWELIRHYMTLPVLVTLIAAVIGNIIGYTWMKEVMADMYYNSYSLATYETIWNTSAFLQTTVVPVILMFVINLFILVSKLKLSPIRFLRHDLSKKGKKKAFRLNTKIPFMHRFRLRVIFQNMPNYITLFCGVFLGGVLTIFGLMFAPMLSDYKELMLEQRIADYQYIVMNSEVETADEQAEKFCMTSLKTNVEGFLEDEVNIYGIENDSRYVDLDCSGDTVWISHSYMAKYGIKEGDTFELRDNFEDKVYSFTVSGIYDYDASIAVFMSRDAFNKMFRKDAEYFTGYFSNVELNDIDDNDIAVKITLSDITKISDQLMDSVGTFVGLLKYFGIIMFLLLMYLLSKQIIEKNATSISMTKILGFTNGEIGGVYIVATSLVVIISLLVTCPLTDITLRLVFEKYLYTMMSGYIPYIISGSCYVKTVLMGIVCYALIAALQLYKINKIPKADALKNVE